MFERDEEVYIVMEMEGMAYLLSQIILDSGPPAPVLTEDIVEGFRYDREREW